jgi:hypothetical protein
MSVSTNQIPSWRGYLGFPFRHIFAKWCPLALASLYRQALYRHDAGQDAGGTKSRYSLTTIEHPVSKKIIQAVIIIVKGKMSASRSQYSSGTCGGSEPDALPISPYLAKWGPEVPAALRALRIEKIRAGTTMKAINAPIVR